MENRKIIFINSSNEKRNIGINKKIIEKNEFSMITDILENKFKENEYIVYRSNEETIDEIINFNNKINTDVYISLHVYDEKNRKGEVGPIIYTTKENSLGDSVSKKIHNQLKLIYNNPNCYKDIKYTENINEIVNIKSPAVYLELFCYDNKYDNKWYIENKEKIIDAIYIGIDNYFKDRY